MSESPGTAQRAQRAAWDRSTETPERQRRVTFASENVVSLPYVTAVIQLLQRTVQYSLHFKVMLKNWEGPQEKLKMN